jgi:hypothetical protein
MPFLCLAQVGNAAHTARIFYDIELGLQTPKAVSILYLEHRQLPKISPNIFTVPNNINKLAGLKELHLWMYDFNLSSVQQRNLQSKLPSTSIAHMPRYI